MKLIARAQVGPGAPEMAPPGLGRANHWLLGHLRAPSRAARPSRRTRTARAAGVRCASEPAAGLIESLARTVAPSARARAYSSRASGPPRPARPGLSLRELATSREPVKQRTRKQKLWSAALARLPQPSESPSGPFPRALYLPSPALFSAVAPPKSAPSARSVHKSLFCRLRGGASPALDCTRSLNGPPIRQASRPAGRTCKTRATQPSRPIVFTLSFRRPPLAVCAPSTSYDGCCCCCSACQLWPPLELFASK